jgi:NAD(P) transhydrogenase subunit alpha
MQLLLLAAESPPAESAVASGPGLPLMAAVTIFVLAIFLGFEIITKIPPTLHTPLMSGSNAISGITLVGAVLAAGSEHHWFAAFLGLLAVIMATINVVGGFLVTNRMLEMFRRKD